jgi:SAM-dependent methyltransferase
VIPVEVLFRNQNEMPDLELMALESCKGKVLDVGAGAGAHSKELIDRGLDVDSIEISDGAVQYMKSIGLNARKINFFDLKNDKYDTILMMMNGIGLCGDIEGLERFLEHLKKLIQPGGQVIFDSSDIAYLYKADDFISSKYYGEISYQYEYHKVKGAWFKWLYVDFKSLEQIAQKFEWQCELIFEDDMDQFLVRMVLAKI